MMDLAVIESEASGPIPNGWSERKLRDVAQLINGRGFKPFEWDTAGLPIIRIQNLNGSDDFNYYSGRYDPKIEIDPGQLLFAWSGSRGTSFGPHIWNGPKGVLNYHTWKVRVNESEIVPGFFFHVLRHLTRIIEDQAHGASALVHVQKWEMEKFPFQCPDDQKEQEAIAEALSDADALIEGLKRLIAKKRLIKQGAMQDLLTAKRRLPGFSGEWVERRLGDIFEIGSSKRVFQSEWRSFGIPFYRAREIVLFAENSEVEKGLHISPELYENLKKVSGVPEIGDLLVTGVGTLGRVYLVDSEEPFYFKDGNIIWFKIRGSMSSEYLKQVFKTDEMMQQIYDSAGGSTVGTYTISNAKKTRINFPPIDEQAAIARVLKDMDAEIQALEIRLKKARQVKEGMMQNLLTGRIRLV